MEQNQQMDQQQHQHQTPANTTWKTLGIIALVLGIVALLFSFIPCLGMYAIFPGIIGIVLGVLSLTQAKKINAPNGMAIAAIACAVLGSAVASYQYYALTKVATNAAGELNKVKDVIEDPKFKDGLENIKKSIDSLNTNLDTTTRY